MICTIINRKSEEQSSLSTSDLQAHVSSTPISNSPRFTSDKPPSGRKEALKKGMYNVHIYILVLKDEI